MHNYTLGLLCTFAAASVWYLFTIIVKNRHHAANALRLGCKPCPILPSKVPLGIDNLWRALRADKEKQFPADVLARFNEMQCRTWKYNALGQYTYMTSEPKNIQAMLATQFSDFDLGSYRRGTFYPMLGDGIFTADGPAWEHSRAMLRPYFAREQVFDRNFHETHAQNLLHALPINPDGWTDPVDLQVLFFRFTIDVATEFLFGESCNSQFSAPGQKRNKPDAGGRANSFAKDYDLALSYVATRARFQNRYWLVNNSEFRTACRRVHKFVDYYVERALKQTFASPPAAAAAAAALGKSSKSPSSDGASRKPVFLDALVSSTRDPTVLRGQLLNLLLAGRDTTAGLLGWLFFLLARHLSVWTKLRACIISDFGNYASPRNLDLKHLTASIYLRHCLAETQRVRTIVPVNGRRAVRNTTLPLGGGKDGKAPLYISKGTQVDYSVHAMHRDKGLWGADADDFRPERWEGRKVAWDFLPFNAGPRVCIGQQFALVEASYVTVRLLQRFERMENMDHDPVERDGMLLTSCAGNGVKVRLWEATAANV